MEQQQRKPPKAKGAIGDDASMATLVPRAREGDAEEEYEGGQDWKMTMWNRRTLGVSETNANVLLAETT